MSKRLGRIGIATPNNPARTQPEMRFAPCIPPDGWSQGWPTLGIDRDVPPRLRTIANEHFDSGAAAARTHHAHTPGLAIVDSKHQVSGRHRGWQFVSHDSLQAAGGAHPIPKTMNPTGQAHHLPSFGLPSAGMPNNGSASPRANSVSGSRSNSLSGVYSSSAAARLNVVRA